MARGRGAEDSRFAWLAAIVFLGLSAGWLVGVLTRSPQTPGEADGAAHAPGEQPAPALPSIAGELARVKALLPVIEEPGATETILQSRRGGRLRTAVPASRLNLAAVTGGALAVAPAGAPRSSRLGASRPSALAPFSRSSSSAGSPGRVSSGRPSSRRPASGPASGGPSSGGSNEGTSPGGGSKGEEAPVVAPSPPPSEGSSPGGGTGETPTEQRKQKAPASCDRPQGSKSPRCP